MDRCSAAPAYQRLSASRRRDLTSSLAKLASIDVRATARTSSSDHANSIAAQRELVLQAGVEQGRVVGVDRHGDSGAPQAFDRMPLHRRGRRRASGSMLGRCPTESACRPAGPRHSGPRSHAPRDRCGRRRAARWRRARLRARSIRRRARCASGLPLRRAGRPRQSAARCVRRWPRCRRSTAPRHADGAVDQRVEQFGRWSTSGAQQAHAQADRGQAVLLGGTKAGIQRIDHFRQPPCQGFQCVGLKIRSRIARTVTASRRLNA